VQEQPAIETPVRTECLLDWLYRSDGVRLSFADCTCRQCSMLLLLLMMMLMMMISAT
jgi:hypothetical protein